MDKEHRILVIDDHPLFRKGVGQLLEMDPSLKLVGEAATAAEGLERIAVLQPDLVLLDLNLGGKSGLDTLREIHSRWPDIRVLVLTVSDAESDLAAALQGGSVGYLLKDMDAEDLLLAIRRASCGEMVLSPRLTSVLGHALRHQAGHEDEEEGALTARERQIVQCIAEGKSNKVVARDLGIAEGTVKVHVKRLLKKMRLRSRVEIAVWAVEHGFKGGGEPHGMH
ncbi:two-component system response regulator NarL [Acidithiobacillus sulfuriphilus]|uniref:two-component system response regulator NarL n=1 Tax=Acidithiobacillus sulfuriphilus TaxID=1867749 RepID=UPI003F644E51